MGCLVQRESQTLSPKDVTEITLATAIDVVRRSLKDDHPGANMAFKRIPQSLS